MKVAEANVTIDLVAWFFNDTFGLFTIESNDRGEIDCVIEQLLAEAIGLT